MNNKQVNFFHHLILIVLLAAVFIQPFLSSRKFSPANDEITHLPSGYTYLKTGDFSLNPQHPPLIKLLAAFPLLFMDLQFSPADIALGEWKFGKKIIFENDADKIFLWGRLGPMLISLLLALFIYKWAGEIWSRSGGLIALFFYAFMPNILAHSQFVTTDLGVTAFAFIACYWLWKYYKTGRIKNLVWTGVFSGLALGSKFSGLLLVPIFIVLIGFKEFSIAGSFARRGLNFFKKFLFVVTIGGLVVWAAYFFPADPMFYLKGYRTVYADKNVNFLFYFNGAYGSTGRWYYFLEAFLIKTPAAFLLALAAV
ncbi:MAG: glycosyltransferase family 39 protein, partial [Patescibacteria group bacterium]